MAPPQPTAFSSRSHTTMKRLLALASAGCALVAAAPAHAAHSMSVGIADDRVLLAGGLMADQAVAEWKRLGVDTVRGSPSGARSLPAPAAGRARPASTAPTPRPPATTGAASTRRSTGSRARGCA